MEFTLLFDRVLRCSRWMGRSIPHAVSLGVSVALVSCAVTQTGSYTTPNTSADREEVSAETPNQGQPGNYEAAAIVTYTWLVDYTSTTGGASERPPRIEEFKAVSLVNQDGQRPDDAVTGPDDKGLWWPALPPRPTLEEMESRQQRQETAGTPRLNRTVQYTLTFDKQGQRVTLPTNDAVYRQVSKLYPNRPPLEIVMDPAQKTVQKINPSFGN